MVKYTKLRYGSNDMNFEFDLSVLETNKSIKSSKLKHLLALFLLSEHLHPL